MITAKPSILSSFLAFLTARAQLFFLPFFDFTFDTILPLDLTKSLVERPPGVTRSLLLNTLALLAFLLLGLGGVATPLAVFKRALLRRGGAGSTSATSSATSSVFFVFFYYFR